MKLVASSYVRIVPHAPYHEKHIMVANSRLIWWQGLERASADGDERADMLMKKFRNRPAEELYRVDRDPYEMNNLAQDPELKPVKEKLHIELKRWMDELGDQGAVLDRVGEKNRKPKSKRQ